ncbi:hypothetical protein JW898_05525 [Candidatus Woesearchaeota archaeon]|nr:hypothetical protein [Candidatus Woesearchaeota archaeon]
MNERAREISDYVNSGRLDILLDDPYLTRLPVEVVDPWEKRLYREERTHAGTLGEREEDELPYD